MRGIPIKDGKFVKKLSPAQLLINEYAKRGTLVPGGELRLRYEEALKFLRDCEMLHLVVLGMDFYKEHVDGIEQVSSTGWNAVWSELVEGHHASERTTAAASKLIADGLPDEATLVSFVLAEDTKKD